MERNIDERGQWKNKIDYLLVLLGNSIGLGNIWRFPYICARNGGGAFLIPFVVFLILCGMPLYFLEIVIGQFSGKGYLHIYDVCPLFRGISYCQLILNVLSTIYYTVIVAWILYYVGCSFMVPLPWTNCNNEWNSPNCISSRISWKYSSLTTNESFKAQNLNSTFVANDTASKDIYHNTSISDYITAPEDFWQNKVLSLSTGFDDIGGLNYYLLMCSTIGWILICLCVIKGVKSVGKVVYVTVSLLYILLTILLIRGLMLDGSVYGLIKFIKPDFKKLLTYQVWIEAAVQVFFSLGPSWGPVIALASFSKFHNNCIRDPIILIVLGEGTSIFAGMVVYAILGFMAKKFSMPIESVVKTGPSLGFMTYPEALAQLPVPNIWAALFFLMLLMVGLDSQIAVCEGLLSGLTDSFPILRRHRSLLTAIFCLCNVFLGIMFCTQGGMYYFQILDWYIGVFSLMMIGLLNCIIFGWIYGTKRLSNDIRLMTGRRLPIVWNIALKFITPLILVILLVFSIVSYKPPTYGSYKYPAHAVIIGWIIAFVPVVPMVVYPIVIMRKTTGGSLFQKIKVSLKPSSKWLPADSQSKNEYEMFNLRQSKL